MPSERRFREFRNRPLLAMAVRRRFEVENVNLECAARVAVFPSIGIAFNRIKKNANSTTMAVLHFLDRKQMLASYDAKMQTNSIASATLRELAGLRDLHYTVIVRDPFSRVLSAFLNKFYRPIFQAKFGNFSLDPDGFSDFTDWLGQGGLECDAHWDLQTKSLFCDLKQFDSVLRFEDYPDCVLDLLAARGIAEPEQLAPMFAKTAEKNMRSHASRRLEEFYTPPVEARVRKLFAEDFSRLGYRDSLDRVLA